MSLPRPEEAVRGELREFIEQNFLYMRPEVRLQDDNPLLELEIIDSLGFLELVEEVQARYGVAVEDVEITEDNFGSISALVRYLDRKLSP